MRSTPHLPLSSAEEERKPLLLSTLKRRDAQVSKNSLDESQLMR